MVRTAVLTVDGRPHDVAVAPDRPLLMVLREELGLTGPKYACGESVCGACTVLLDGAVARACVTPLADVAGRSVTTVHGLTSEGRLHPVQRAFVEERALQCGYCTPGMVITATALLRETQHPDDAAIVEAMDGNLCRCGVYGRIVRAIRRAADEGDARTADTPIGQDRPETATFGRPARPWDRGDPDDRERFE